MKNIYIWLCCMIILLSMCFTVPVSAAETHAATDPAPSVTDVVVTEEDLSQWETVYGIYDFSENQARATGLISATQITLSKSGSNLLVSGYTKGTENVDKTGFTYVKLQRLVNGSWQDYVTWTDLYSDSNYCALGKSVAAASGYTYRVICNHYAEKTTLLFFKSTQDSYNQTGSLSF